MPVKSRQAPTGGLNHIDSYDDMPEADAIYLDNWICDQGRVRLREGTRLLTTIGTGRIGTIMEYGQRGIIATGGGLHQLTSTRYRDKRDLRNIPVPRSTEIGSGFSSDDWDYDVFNNLLVMVNGSDLGQVWDGQDLVDLNFTSGITTPSEITGCGQFKGRMFYWKRFDAGFYYCEAGSYQGELTYFDLKNWVSKLATLRVFFTWSADAGDGSDDYAIFVMDTGEVLVYQGSDPSDIDQWNLSGRYKMGEPISDRGNCKLAGDQVIITRDGWQNFAPIWDIGDSMTSGLGRKIAPMARDLVNEYFFNPGWEAHYLAEENLVLINIPTSTTTARQNIMNTNTGAWSSFSGWNATTFGQIDGKTYYGTSDGKVVRCFSNFDDMGEPIVTDAMPSYSYLSGRTGMKQVTGLRPVMGIEDFGAFAVDLSADYEIPKRPDPIYTEKDTGAVPWGSPWGSPWGYNVRSDIDGEWLSLNAHGYSHSFRCSTITKGTAVTWFSTNVLFRDGGFN